MKKKHSLKLIDGTFLAEDAKNVLSTLIGAKINFHSIELFSHRERYSTDKQFSEKRIEELKEARKYLELIIKEAKENKKNLYIESFINIHWED